MAGRRRAAALERLDALRKEHFGRLVSSLFCLAISAREGLLFRANDDGEPSGIGRTANFGQIDALGMTNVVVVVVRYFGGVSLRRALPVSSTLIAKPPL